MNSNNKMSTFPTLFNCNVRSLDSVTKREIEHILCSNEFSIMCITETWLDSAAFMQIRDHTLYLSNRTTGRKGGGVAIYVSNNMCSMQVGKAYSDRSFEALAVKILKSNGSSIVVITVYRVGSIQADDEFVDKLKQYIESLKLGSTQYVLVGDFNLPGINWKEMGGRTKLENEFLDFIVDMGLTQHVEEATHKKGNILDLVLSSEPDLAFNTTVGAPISDHLIVSCQVRFAVGGKSRHNSSVPFTNYWDVDYRAVEVELAQVDWVSRFAQPGSIDSKYKVFMDTVNEAISKWTPPATYNKKGWPVYLTKLREKSRRQFSLFKQNKISEATYKSSYSAYRSALRAHMKEVEQKVISSGDMNRFWRYVKSKDSSKRELPPIADSQGVLRSDDLERATIINSHFVSVFTTDNNKRFVAPSKNIHSPMALPQITDVVVYSYLKQVRRKTSSGPDGIASIVLNELKEVLALPLSLLFQISLETGELPALWKQSTVTPVFKSGDPTNAKNYRPISLTCAPCRLFEKIIVAELTSHFFKNNIISEYQHGFVKKRSTTTQLIEYQRDLVANAAKGQCTDSVYLDIQKAFDTVNYRRLLMILEAYGTHPKVQRWLCSYLTGRSQKVKVNGVLSSQVDVISGVPQGSVLGPYLFNVYINDVEECIKKSKILLYADDAKIYISHSIKDYIIALQTDLDSVYRWFLDRQLAVAVQKCAVLHIGRKNQKHTYTLNGAPLAQVDCIRDLGVQMSSDMKPRLHLRKQAQKASAIVNNLFRCFSFSKSSFLKVYETKVLPIMEYSVEALINIKKTYWEPVEKVQRRFSKRLVPNMSYEKRIEHLGVQPLSLRRAVKDLCLAHRYVYGHMSFPNSVFPLHASGSLVQSRTRGNGLKMVSNGSTQIEQSFIGYRASLVWNKLPSDIVRIPEPCSFKKRVTEYLMGHKNIYDHYNC